MNRLGNLIIYIDFGGEYIHKHSLVGCVLWKYLKQVDNKSITTSIKEFLKLSRSGMKKLCDTVDIRYILEILNLKYAQVFIDNQCDDVYHIYSDQQLNNSIPSDSFAQQKPIVAFIDKILATEKPIRRSSQVKKNIELTFWFITYMESSLTKEN